MVRYGRSASGRKRRSEKHSKCEDVKQQRRGNHVIEQIAVQVAVLFRGARSKCVAKPMLLTRCLAQPVTILALARRLIAMPLAKTSPSEAIA